MGHLGMTDTELRSEAEFALAEQLAAAASIREELAREEQERAIRREIRFKRKMERTEAPPELIEEMESKTPWPRARVRKMRFACGFSQHKLAQLAGVSIKTAAGWETDSLVPRAYWEKLDEISEEYEQDITGVFSPDFWTSEQIASLRESLHETKSEFAKRLGRGRESVRRWEAGEGRPTIAVVGRLAELYLKVNGEE